MEDTIAQLRTYDAYNDATATLSVGEEPEQIPAVVVGADFFDVLGVKPVLGRGFLPIEERPGGQHVTVLGYALWQRRFGGDPAILGRTVTFDSIGYEVVGVMPRGFRFPEDVGLWFPLVFTARDIGPNHRGAHYLGAIGRLKPGVTVAPGDRRSCGNRTVDRRAISQQGRGVWNLGAADLRRHCRRRPAAAADALGAVAFVLLIACVNVSNLLLARSTTRRTEIALRSALGAGRWRIVRQLLAESVLLSVAGGVVGVVLATWGVRVLSTLLPQDLPRAESVGVNLSVLLFSLAVSLLTGILFGVTPAMYAASPDLAAFLKDARRDGSPNGRRALRNVLVIGEVALSLVLLAGAGLAMRSFDRLSAVTPGFDPRGLLVANVVAPESRYPDSAALARLYRDYVQGLAAQPGVVAAGAVSIPPLARGGFGGTFTIVGRNESDNQNMQVRCVTPGYFEALRISLRRGRLLTAQDAEHAAPVAIITEESARRYWPGDDPIGKRIRIHVSMGTREPEREIVGVVGDVKTRALDEAAPPVVYTPHAQYPSDAMTVFVRTTGDPQGLLPGVKAQLATIDRDLAITRVRTGTQLVAASIAQPRFRMILLGFFAAMALALAAIGLYGVMAFSVSQRRTELGMRMALGADASSLLRLVLRQGLTPVAIGLAIGLPAAALLTQVMSGLLFEIDTFDPLTFAGVAALLAGVATGACYLPARRAIALDPLAAIRHE